MNYSISAKSKVKDKGEIDIKETKVIFGTTAGSAETYANPAELFLAAFSACILKNVERFSQLMKFDYKHAEVTVKAERLEKPPRMENINYELIIHSKDEKLNLDLLQKNIEKHGTIYNMAQAICIINCEIILSSNY